jgi:hypothetical protein
MAFRRKERVRVKIKAKNINSRFCGGRSSCSLQRFSGMSQGHRLRGWWKECGDKDNFKTCIPVNVAR